MHGGSIVVTLTVNNKEITVADGTLILDAAREAGFDIPTFCYQARLLGLGSCRMCLVEIEGQRKLQPSCVTPVMHDMKVNTHSEVVTNTRQTVLEFLLSNHPLDCPVCDKGGECELQDLVLLHGPRKGRFAEEKHRFHDKDYILSPVIVKNSNRCVQCMRCVRVCRDTVGVNALGAIGRGVNQEETSFLKGGLDCDHCGNCIEVCPVGSFMRLPYRYKSRPWDLKKVETVCVYCGTGCRMSLEARDGKVMRSVSYGDTGINNDTLCARGRFGFDFINSRERLKSPLIKEGAGFREATWDEALALVRDKFSGVNGKKIGGIASSRLTNEDLFLFQKLFRSVFNSNNMDSDSRWPDGSAKRFVRAMGISGNGINLTDAIASDTMLILGSMISDENPVTDYIIRRLSSERVMNITIAYPRRMKLDSSANKVLRLQPASEGSLLAGMAKAIVEAKGDELSSVLNDDILSSLRALDEEDISRITGLSLDKIAEASEGLSNGRVITIMVGTDALRYDSGIENITVLKGVLEALGKEVKLFPVIDTSNQRGAWDMGVSSSFLPDYRPLDEEGLGCGGMLESARDGDLEALYIVGEDVVSMFPDRTLAEDALNKVDFLVVQDMFMTDTAKMADVILPGTSVAEKNGTFTNQEGRVQSINRLLVPPGEARDDWEIMASIGRMLNHTFAYRTISQIQGEIKQSSLRYDKVPFAVTKGLGPLTEGVELSGDTFVTVATICEADKAYPFQLMRGNHLLHGGTLSSRSETLSSLLGEGYLEISEEDAVELGITTGDVASVQRGAFSLRAKVKVAKGTLKGVAFIPENFADLHVNGFLSKEKCIPGVIITKV